MPPRRKRPPTPPVTLPSGRPDEEEVFSVHSIGDSSVSPPYVETGAVKRSKHGGGANGSGRRSTQQRNGNGKAATFEPAEAALTISDTSSDAAGLSKDDTDDERDLVLEEVSLPAHVPDHETDTLQGQLEDDENIEFEDVDVGSGQPYEEQADEEDANAYAAVYQAAEAGASAHDAEAQGPVVYYDGKGQPSGLSISLAGPGKSASLPNSKKKGNIVTPRDRQIRLATHKWTVLSMIAHARVRNEMVNDDSLRDDLYGMVPNNFLEKLRMIHPKKVPLQDERVRQFENFIRDLTRWWSYKFRLDPLLTTCGALRQPDADLLAGVFPSPGRRVDGWIVESARERQDRHREERRVRSSDGKGKSRLDLNHGGPPLNGSKSKGKRKATDEQVTDTSSTSQHPLPEITLFGIGDSTSPTYLRLADVAEEIHSVEEMVAHVQSMNGSREMSAQLFVGLCRALGIPSRLVISIQAPSWSIGAGKVAGTAGAVSDKGQGGNLAKRKHSHGAEMQKKKRLQAVRKAVDVMTSDDESFVGVASDSMDESYGNTPTRTPLSLSSKTVRTTSTTASPASSRAGSVVHQVPSVRTSMRVSRRRGRSSDKSMRTPEPASVGKANNAAAKGKGDEDQDYRSEKWRGLEKPLEVKFEPKLRAQKPKPLKPTEVAPAMPDIDPVDTSSPPTMWVEVFSKPWQKWITVDPVRGMVEPLGNRQMEPNVSDKSNRLVYVLGFEEDGYARDVTARYTRTLHSRVSRMRPPATKKGGETVDWWARTVAAVHRPQKLDRDAAEDMELEMAASREPMPSSVAAFKDHPVYTLEKHLRRDEVIFPAKQAGTFQGMPVFLRSNVVPCRSARQWYNEGRVVKDGEEALKWVKSRGYTLANKRAEEEARQQGIEGLQEGLYALFQTELYIPPAVQDGQVPTNSFGNIDLFVDTMLPSGAAHIPYNGAAKVAKKLGVNYAEAIVGFEFRKHRSMPKLKGIVVAEEHADMIMEAYWESEHVSAEREMIRKRDRLFKNWKKLLNAIKIQERVQREYGAAGEDVTEEAEVSPDTTPSRLSDADGDELQAYRNAEAGDEGQDEDGEDAAPGGFIVE